MMHQPKYHVSFGLCKMILWTQALGKRYQLTQLPMVEALALIC